MAWVYLLLAGVFEVVWASTMKASQGFTRPLPTLITVIAMLVSVWLLALAMRSLPLGTAYVIWTGVGAVGAFIVGLVFYSEPATFFRIASVGLIVIGLTGLKLSSGH